LEGIRNCRETELKVYEDSSSCGKVALMNDPDVKLLILIVLIAGLAGAFWFFRDDVFPAVDEPVVIQAEPVVADEPARSEPVYPLSPLGSPGSIDHNLIPLPPLDDSDSYFLLAMIDNFGPEVGRLLVNEALIDKIVATVDNLPRSHLAEKVRPVGRLSTTFAVDATDESGQIFLGSDNYQRYDQLVNLLVNADLDEFAATYRRFYPLFQQSYERLGYPGAYFNDRVVEVIDHLLATPDSDERIRLIRPNVMYEFADAELEALSSGQKLLLRMGSEHAKEIKQTLRDLRARITLG